MNDNILCLYYSRTGNTKKAMEEVAEALDCECLEIRDKVDRSGTMGYLRCCFDAMHKRTSAGPPADVGQGAGGAAVRLPL